MSALSPTSLPDAFPDSSVEHLVIGVFDGVHQGHRALFEAARREAGSRPLTALTFWPHPLSLIRPELAPPLLCSLSTRIQGLNDAGASHIVVAEFNSKLRTHTAVQFLALILDKFPRLRGMTVGENFRFGHNREGDTSALEHFSLRHKIAFLRLSRLSDSFGPISSSRIRALIQAADFTQAEELLGHPWFVQSEVLMGDQIGRRLGFPTANLDPTGLCLPTDGVYGCRAELDGTTHLAAVNLGWRPTVNKPTQLRLEAHLLDFSGYLYGKSLKLSSWMPIRNEKRFTGLDALKQQIGEDVSQVRTLFAQTGLD